MDDLLEGLLSGAADGCMVVVTAFLGLLLLAMLVQLLFEPAFWLVAGMVGIVTAVLRRRRRDRADTTIDPT